MNTKKFVFVLPLLLILLLQAFSPVPAYAAGSVGTGTPESCTEDALDMALAGGDAVTFNCGGPATIRLTSTKVINLNTQIDGAGVITLDGQDAVRLFTVNSTAVFDLSNLTLSNGKVAGGDGGAILINQGATVTIKNSTLYSNETIDGYGGAIMVNQGATVNITNSTLSNNTATNTTVTGGEIIDGFGGAIMIKSMTPEGTIVNISNSTLSNNFVMNGYGGGIYVGGGTLNVIDSTFSNNNADVESLGDLSLGGGAIQNNDGTVNISGSTFKENSVTSHTADGGAIYNGDYDATLIGANNEVGGTPDDKLDILNITNSTFYGNYLQNNSGLPTSGNAAGAIRSSSILTITHSTLSNNDSGTPGVDAAAGAVTITDGYATYTNNIFANSTGADCAVRLPISGQTSVGNLIENNAPLYGWGCGIPVESGDPLLGPLQMNGGPTETMAPGIGSPAIDMAASCEAAADQRNVLRPQPSGASCDLGAVEVESIAPTVTNVTSTTLDGVYGVDHLVGITVTFSEIVKVEGIPQLTLETGATDHKANYTSGSGTNTLTFTYTVQPGDYSTDLDYASPTALQTIGGSITDVALNPANLTLPVPGQAGSLGANKAIAIDARAPILFSFVRQNPATSPTSADVLVFRARFSGTVLGVDTTDFAVSGGTTATVTNVSAVDLGTYDITVSGGNLASFIGTVGLNLSNPYITDPNGTRLPQDEPAIDETYVLDNSVPNVVSILRTDPDPTTAAIVHFSVTFSKPVLNVGMNDFVLYKAGTNKVTITNVSGSGATYTVSVDTGTKYGIIRLDVPVSASIEDEIGNPLSGLPYKSGQTYTINKTLTFADVPATHPYWEDIEILYANGLTGGCSTSPLKFCPDQSMNRGQAAVFNLRANFGSSYVPPVPVHYFKDDWKKGPWAETWAEGMRNTGLSAGCQVSPPKYCPWDLMPREQAVIFALRMKYGTNYTPPPATGTLFADMTNPGYYATSWAEQAYKDGIIPNCGMTGGKPNFCPKVLVSRGLAAYMIVRAKSLTMP